MKMNRFLKNLCTRLAPLFRLWPEEELWFDEDQLGGEQDQWGGTTKNYGTTRTSGAREQVSNQSQEQAGELEKSRQGSR